MACKGSEVDPGCQQSASNRTSCSLVWLVRASEVSTVYLRRHGEELGSGVGPETEAKSSHGRGHRFETCHALRAAACGGHRGADLTLPLRGSRSSRGMPGGQAAGTANIPDKQAAVS